MEVLAVVSQLEVTLPMQESLLAEVLLPDEVNPRKEAVPPKGGGPNPSNDDSINRG